MWNYVFKNLLARKVRTTLCILGVAVSVALIVALFALVDGMRSSMDTYMVRSGASLVVFTREAADLTFSRVREKEIEEIARLPGVDAVARANFTAIMAPRLGPGHRHAGFILVFGRIPGERSMLKYEKLLLEGRLPRRSEEILVGEYAAEQLGIRVGDRFPLFDRPLLGIREYEVVGIYRSEISWENLGLVVDARVVREHLNQKDTYSLVFVYTRPSDAESVRARIEKNFPHLVAMPSGEFSERFSEQLKYIDEFLAIMTVVALVVGVLGVLNTMMMSISERTREIGTLRAVGWSRACVLVLVVLEGAVLAAFGGLAGLAAGTAGTEFLLWWFPSGLLEAIYDPHVFLAGIAVALAAGIFGALYPALRAASLRPVEALRYE